MIPKLKKWLNSSLWFPEEEKYYSVIKRLNEGDNGIDIVFHSNSNNTSLVITIHDRKI